MKYKRQRRVKRTLKFYKNNFNFRTPYQILVDSTFCHQALKCKLNIMEQMPKYLEDPNARLYTTPCVVMETEKLGPKAYGAMRVVKQFKVRKCGHEKNSTISAEECILSMVQDSNPEHLMVATTDPQLSSKCGLLPGVPLLYISKKSNAINLEDPSDLSIGIANKNMKAAVEIPQEQRKTLQQLRPAAESVPIRKKRKAKGPNPLSCKKKKMKPNPKVPTTSQTDKVAKKKPRKKAKKVFSLPETSNSVNSSCSSLFKINANV